MTTTIMTTGTMIVAAIGALEVFGFVLLIVSGRADDRIERFRGVGKVSPSGRPAKPTVPPAVPLKPPPAPAPTARRPDPVAEFDGADEGLPGFLQHAEERCVGTWLPYRQPGVIRCTHCAAVHSATPEHERAAIAENRAGIRLMALTRTGVELYGCDPARSPWHREAA